MTRTLFIINDGAFADMPQALRDRTVAETKTLFDFVSLSVETRLPANLPAAIDFTDSIVKVVDTNAEVNALQNQANRGQIANIRFSITKRGLGLNIAVAQRAPAVPERGGVGFQWKTVQTVGTDRVGVTVTGGVASLEAVRSDVLTAFAGDRSKQEILVDQRKAIEKATKRSATKPGDLAGHPVLGAAHYFMKAQSLTDTAALVTWELEGKVLKDWPQRNQEAVGTALARLIAHEARHQYVLDHFNGGGLGADSAVLFGQRDFERFDPADQRLIGGALQRLETEQRQATVHLETFPASQPSPWL